MPDNANAGTPKGQASHGARHYLVANGRRVGYVQGIDWNKAINQLDVEVLDNLLTEEHVIGGVTYTGSARKVKVVGKSLIEAGITVPLAQALTRAPLSMQLVDRPTDKVLRTWRRIALTGQSESISKGVLTVSNLSFKCIDSTDENGIVDI